MLPELEGLRAVAALGIVTTHVAFQTAVGSPLLERFDFFVAVFFALSAFLLARGPWRGGYFARRFARIAPAYLVCVGVVLLTLPPLARVSLSQVVANVALVRVCAGLAYRRAHAPMVPVHRVHLLPRLAGVYGAGAAGRWGALIAACVVGLLWPWVVWGHYDPDVLNLQIWPFSYAPWFAVGLVLAELERYGVRYAGPRWPFALAALPVAWFAGAVGPAGLAHPTPREFNARVILGALFAALVVAPYALGPRFSGTVLASAPMRALGKWSYSIFLWHMAVLYWVFPVLGVPLFGGHFALVLLATLTASIAVAFISYELVEVPCARWLRARIPARTSDGASSRVGAEERDLERDAERTGRDASGAERSGAGARDAERGGAGASAGEGARLHAE
ncbi:acyltransferase [Corynebacterium sp. Marseille-P4321]|uniref:acyltransferase family protein n=1 Tax=Corynebacterium sp. Marseille-P4321 TaxID=2736603 RepID=UPI0020CA369C|nr:acyltransferase [Corynebacterium sp. Marseille-P4321]